VFKLLSELGLKFSDFVFIWLFKFLIRYCVTVFINVSVRTKVFKADQFIKLLVVQQKDFFFGESKVVFGYRSVFKPCFEFTSPNYIFTVKVIVLLKKVVQVLLLVLFLV